MGVTPQRREANRHLPADIATAASPRGRRVAIAGLEVISQSHGNLKETFRHTAGVVTGWIAGNIRDHIASRQPLVWFLALIAGFAVSAGAIVFREAIGWFQLFWLGDSSEAVASAARGWRRGGYSLA